MYTLPEIDETLLSAEMREELRIARANLRKSRESLQDTCSKFVAGIKETHQRLTKKSNEDSAKMLAEFNRKADIRTTASLERLDKLFNR